MSARIGPLKGSRHALVPQQLLTQWDSVVRQHAHRPALASSGAGYTFAAADQLAGAVAAELRAVLDTSARAPVGILCGHTPEAVIAILGVMKAGHIVVLLDPHLPALRLREIVEIAGLQVCLTDDDNHARTSDLGDQLTRVVKLDRLLSDAPTAGDATAAMPTFAADPTDESVGAVSIVFTSGSTGRPKGVVQTTGQLLNDVRTHHERFRLSPQDRVALVLPYGFAAGFSLLWGALLNGAGLWSYDPRDGGTRGLAAWITDNALTTLHCTPHLLRSLAGSLPADAVLSSLRLVSTVGEAVHGSDVAAIRPHLDPAASFANWTGSSEIGILSIYEIPGGSEIPSGSVPAGRLAPNRTVRLIAEDGGLAPEGEAGEIEVASPYLSGGYWNDPDSTATRFFLGSDDVPVCRQGDQGRFDANGNLLLLGRGDAVVKIRGYLVDPSEVEAALLALDGVKEVVVEPVFELAAPTRLIAFVVPHAHLRTDSPAALRRYLRDRFPEYMVPSQIVPLVELPRNERGKVDRRSLPTTNPRVITEHPSSQWELAVADLWAEVLGVEALGLADDFMSLGGDSLTAEEMLARVNDRFNVALASTDLLEAPTLREFTRRVTLGSSSLPSHPDVVTLQTGVGTPIFCFAGSGALALTFAALARRFAGRSVHAFQAHGLERRGVPDWSVEAAATRFLEIIRILRPHGPYILIGHSFGGLIALEIERLLTGAGEPVEVVGLLDTWMPQRGGTSGSSLPPTTDQVGAPTLRSRGLALVVDNVARVLPSDVPLTRWVTQRVQTRLAGVVPFRGQGQFDAFFQMGVKVAQKYRLRPTKVRTVLVLADNNPDGPQAWTDILTGPVHRIDLPCEHSSILREPHVAVLATALHAELARPAS